MTITMPNESPAARNKTHPFTFREATHIPASGGVNLAASTSMGPIASLASDRFAVGPQAPLQVPLKSSRLGSHSVTPALRVIAHPAPNDSGLGAGEENKRPESQGMGDLLAKLAQQEALLRHQQNTLAATDNGRGRRVQQNMRDLESLSDDSVPITPATDSFDAPLSRYSDGNGQPTAYGKPAVAMHAPGAHGGESDEMARLKRELEVAKDKIARMDQELCQTRITKQSIDQLLASPSDREFRVPVKPEPTIDNNIKSLGATANNVRNPRDAWNTFGDAPAPKVNAVSTTIPASYNHSLGIWGNPPRAVPSLGLTSGGGMAGNGIMSNGMAGNGMAGNGMAGNGMAGNGIGGNRITGNGVTGNSIAGNGIAGNGISGNGIAGNGISGNGIAGNGIANHGIAGNSIAGNGITSNGIAGGGGIARSGTIGRESTVGGPVGINRFPASSHGVGQSLLLRQPVPLPGLSTAQNSAPILMPRRAQGPGGRGGMWPGGRGPAWGPYSNQTGFQEGPAPPPQPWGSGPFVPVPTPAAYQPQPIGTRLSPMAAEFGGAPANVNSWNGPTHPPGQTYISPIEPLNYRRLLDRSVTCDWKYIVDKIVCSNDQQASIFLQQKLKMGTAEQKFAIIDAIVAQAYPLMLNRFGNFLIQRCFEHGTKEQIAAIACAIRGNTLTLSMDSFGCHVVQKAFDCVSEEHKAVMVHELLRRIPETVIHRHACHVWQKLFELRWNDSPPQIMKYVNEALRGMWHEVALGETGSLVVQNIFENCLEEDKRPCINEVLASIDIVSRGQFGNWCIQHICEHGAPADRNRAVEHVLRNAADFSMDQFASKVVEKCLKIGGAEFLERYLARVCEGRPDRPRIPLIDIASDQYGNFLIQYILMHANTQHREIVASHIRKHMVSLRGSKFGAKVGMLCSNPAVATRPGPAVPPYVNRFGVPGRFGGSFR